MSKKNIQRREIDDLFDYDEDKRTDLCFDAFSTVFKEVKMDKLQGCCVSGAHIFKDEIKGASNIARIRAIPCLLDTVVRVQDRC
mgnify:CR=1 FL=1